MPSQHCRNYDGPISVTGCAERPLLSPRPRKHTRRTQLRSKLSFCGTGALGEEGMLAIEDGHDRFRRWFAFIKRTRARRTGNRDGVSARHLPTEDARPAVSTRGTLCPPALIVLRPPAPESARAAYRRTRTRRNLRGTACVRGDECVDMYGGGFRQEANFGT